VLQRGDGTVHPYGRRRVGVRLRARFGPRALKAAVRSVFFAPALLFLMFLVLYPVLQTVFITYLSPTGAPTLGIYRAVLSDPETINPNLSWPPPLGTLIHNALWAGIHLPISLLFGLWM